MLDTGRLGSVGARLLVASLMVVIGCSGGGGGGAAEGGDLPDLTGPTVVSVVPGASGVPIGAKLAVVLSERPDVATVDGTSVRIDGVDAALSSRCSALFLDPANDLAFDTSYTLSVSGLKDLVGNVMATPYQLDFRTTAPAHASAIAADTLDTYALRDDGSVFGWGFMFLGMDGPTPGLLPGGTADYASIWSGSTLTLLRSGGTVFTWDDWSGYPPGHVAGLVEVTAAAAGYAHHVARKSDGTVWAWGGNDHGEIGDGSTSERATPVQVGGLGNVVALAAGSHHSLALQDDGTMWAWGDNTHGQLGDGTRNQSTTPVEVTGLANVTAIAAGSAFSLALTADGTVWKWGHATLWTGSGWEPRSTPVQMTALPAGEIVSIAAGSYHALALARDGSVWTWGDNTWGQLGDGSSGLTTYTVAVGGLPQIQALAGGTMHSVAFASDGSIFTWGDNAYGQLGDGTTQQRKTPVRVAESMTTLSAPRVPIGVQAAAGDRNVRISWLPVPGATSYDIYIRPSSTVSPSNGTKVECVRSPHLVAGLTPGVLHSACVVASNAYGDGPCSNVVTATPTGPPPPPPGGGSCPTAQYCGVVTNGAQWMGAWYPKSCPCPAGLVDHGGNDDNVLCGLPGTGHDCRYCGCP